MMMQPQEYFIASTSSGGFPLGFGTWTLLNGSSTHVVPPAKQMVRAMC